MTVKNDRDLLIEGISQRLMVVYATELMSLVLKSYETSFFYSALREGLHKDLDRLRSQAS